MDPFSLKIQRKMSKIEGLLLDLNNEIFTATQYLIRLREKSRKIVSNLNNITVPANYLKDFMDVNSFFLKYLSILTEINCKFEMLEMFEKTFPNTTSIGKAVISELRSGNLDQLNLLFKNESILDIKFSESNVDSKKIIVEQLLESETSPSIKSSKEKNSKKKSKIRNSRNSQKVRTDNNKNKKIFSSGKSSKKLMRKIKNESNTKSCSTNFFEKNSDLQDDLQDTLKPKNVGKKDINCLNKKIESEKSGLSKNSLINCNAEGIEPLSSVVRSCSPSLDSICNPALDKVGVSEIQSPVGGIPDIEVVLSQNNQRSFSSGISNYNYVKSSKCERQRVINKPIEKENANIVRKLGAEYDVAIEHIKSPSEFYISFIDDQSNLLELEKRLKLIPESKRKIINKKIENKKALLSEEIGSYALFYSKCDEMWCRAKITNWCLNFEDDFVNIFLIDYGESKCVLVDDLISMPECYRQYPAFCQRCHLYGVFPLDVNVDDDGETLFWEKEVTEKMKFLTENSKNIRIKIALDDCLNSFNSLPVTLWLVDQGNQCVNELLMKSKCAIGGSTNKIEIIDNHIFVNENLNSWNPMKEDFESYQNLYDFDIKDPAAFIYGYVGKDYEKTCPHFAKTGHCFKGQACRKEHKKLDPLGFTTDQEEIYKNAFNILNVPFSDSVLNVRVTCVLSINQFCCIPEDQCLSHSDEEDLQSLLKFMNTIENVREMKKLLVPPSTGQIVIAKYSEDSSWYRARILESEPEKDAYKVMFVDYGNKEILRLSEIRAIEAKYLHLPFQVMHCSIFGIDPNPEVPREQVIDYLNSKMYDDHITIEIIRRLPGEDVNLLVHVFDHNGRNFGEDLIAKNYAVFKKEMVICNHSLSVPG